MCSLRQRKAKEGNGKSVNRRNGESKIPGPRFTDSPFPRLFIPGSIGKLRLKNRILMPAMHIPHGGRRITPMLERFYEERAAGGASLIMVGGAGIDLVGSGKTMLGIEDDSYIEEYSRLAEIVKRHNTGFGIQLFHAGRYQPSRHSGIQPIAPSAVRSKLTGETPRAMTLEQINEIVELFGLAAARVKQTGADCVEVIGSAGYLISQFLSPLTNRRTDEYGGTLENRMRFGLEVAKSINQQCGGDFPLIFRIAGNDFVEGSNDHTTAARFAEELESVGVDAINVTGGWHETRVPQLPGFVPRGAFSYLARRVKDAVTIPVMASNRINDPYTAEKILANGWADFVNMGRALLADPDLPNKVLNGQIDELIPCIACNQTCFDNMFEDKPVSCLVNPRAGRELELNVIRTSNPRNVLIVGAGAAGLQAALIAKQRGHRVTVYEKSNRIGGQLHQCWRSHGKSEWQNLLSYFEHQIRKHNIPVELSTTVDLALIERLQPDVVIIAAGAKPGRPDIHGVNLPHVFLAEDFLEERVEVGRNVVVIGGGPIGVEVANDLARIGTIDAATIEFLLNYEAEELTAVKELMIRGTKQVSIIERGSILGEGLGLSSRWVLLRELKKRGVRILTKATAVEITEKSVFFQQNGQVADVSADTVILAAGYLSNNRLADNLKGFAGELHVIGDAVQSRKAVEAIYEGYLIATKL